jgi:hypothetical protein
MSAPAEQYVTLFRQHYRSVKELLAANLKRIRQLKNDPLVTPHEIRTLSLSSRSLQNQLTAMRGVAPAGAICPRCDAEQLYASLDAAMKPILESLHEERLARRDPRLPDEPEGVDFLVKP